MNFIDNEHLAGLSMSCPRLLHVNSITAVQTSGQLLENKDYRKNTGGIFREYFHQIFMKYKYKEIKS